MIKITLNEQEQTGNYNFRIPNQVMTRGFANTFKDIALDLCLLSVEMIMRKGTPDYFQTFIYHAPSGTDIPYWVIHDETVVTYLLPEEY